MSSDGKHLKNLVAWIESTLVPNGFEVVQKLRTRGAEVGGGEFDIVLQGRVGSLNLKWLIECPDRPSEGPAPSSWVQQLMGRKQGFRFDVVTAVSTTGFTADALAMARTFRISTRTVRGLTPEEFSSWVSPSISSKPSPRWSRAGAPALGRPSCR
ncbi:MULTISPECIES: restriction endonuclease [unclassified Pseudomonas]|uniref:restriction endonuclease n=1 Tax=unclassified Pseudomonas TaxID=196821 RepID=UPI0015A45FC7|nr:restriction endonuclease [Pseudomonas sp. IPO3779]NWD20193.1 restriction endonuclease [Pseudomonas sp. IPO3778]